MPDVIVVGAGAAGLMAAYAALKNNNSVTVLEKNEKAGKKLYITGKGRCNLTNDAEFSDFLENIVSNSKFLMSSLRQFSNEDTQEFFSARQVPLKTERGGRVFPLSDKASDITNCLVKEILRLGGKIRYNEEVKGVLIKNGEINGVLTGFAEYYARHTIIATGGLSYPSTGSTGDGYKFAREAGHTVLELKPALSAIELTDKFCKDLQGLSLKNIALKAETNGKEIFGGFGEMLFAHFGISGPLVLTLSSKINRLNLERVSLFLDLKPALSLEVLDERLKRDFLQLNGKILKNSLDLLLPKKLIPIIIEESKVNPFKKNSEITREERKRLLSSIKSFKLNIGGLRPLSEAIVTAGGVSVDEINPKTMESKLIKGLYFCGEVLDVDALTGGFNIQIAFSTGYAAGSRIG